MIFLVFILFIAPSTLHEVLSEPDSPETRTIKPSKFSDKKDADFDVALISRLRKFLDELEDAIKPEPMMRGKQMTIESLEEKDRTEHQRRDEIGQTEPRETYGIFTSFMNQLIMILLKFDKNGVAMFVKILISEMRKYFSPKAVTFHKIVFDPRLEAFMMNTLNEWKHRSPKHLRKDLHRVSKDAMNSKKSTFGKFAETINFIFNKKDGRKLKRIIKSYDKLTDKDDDVMVTKMVSDCLKFFFVDKYKTLNFLERTVLSSAITYLADYLSTFYYSKTIFRNSTASLRKEIDQTIVKSDDLYPYDDASNKRRSDAIIPEMSPIEKASIEKVLKDSSVETSVKREENFEIKVPVNGVIQVNQDINFKVNNDVKNKTTTTAYTDINYYDYKHGIELRNYTVLSVNHNTRRRLLGSVEENRRYFRRNFVHDGRDEFLQTIEDNVESNDDDDDSSDDVHEKQYDAPHRDKDDALYNYEDKDLLLGGKMFESQESFFLREGMGRAGLGPDGAELVGMGLEGMGREGMGRGGMGRDAMGRDGMGRDGMGRDDMGRDGMGLEGMGLDGMGLEGMGLDGMRRDGMGRDGMERGGMGRDAMGRDDMGRDGMGLEGMGLEGMGLDGMRRDGMGRDGMKQDAMAKESIGRYVPPPNARLPLLYRNFRKMA